MSTNLTYGPVAPSERIVSLDVLRGFAVLGILIMNIQSYAMPGAAYFNPMAYGDLTGLNKWVWILSHIFADQKFMTLFSILFGAGIVLMTGKVEARGQRSAGLHYRRTFWLFIIGMMHAYLLWHGDILVTYAAGNGVIQMGNPDGPTFETVLPHLDDHWFRHWHTGGKLGGD